MVHEVRRRNVVQREGIERWYKIKVDIIRKHCHKRGMKKTKYINLIKRDVIFLTNFVFGRYRWSHPKTFTSLVHLTGRTLLRNFGSCVYPSVPVSFEGDSKSHRSHLTQVSMPGKVKGHHKCVACHGRRNSEIRHSCVSHRICCLEYTYLRPIPTSVCDLVDLLFVWIVVSCPACKHWS